MISRHINFFNTHATNCDKQTRAARRIMARASNKMLGQLGYSTCVCVCLLSGGGEQIGNWKQQEVPLNPLKVSGDEPRAAGNGPLTLLKKPQPCTEHAVTR